MDPKMVFKDVDQRLKYALRDNNNKGVIASSIIKDKKHSTHSAKMSKQMISIIV